MGKFRFSYFEVLMYCKELKNVCTHNENAVIILNLKEPAHEIMVFIT